MPNTASKNIILEEFSKYGWKLKTQNKNNGYFYKPGHPGKFIIEKTNNPINPIKLSAPIPNTELQFTTTYSLLEEHVASHDMIKHLNNYINKNYIYPKQLPTTTDEIEWA